MKKTIIFTSVAIATLFAFSSCQKENLENNGPENSLRIITAEFENNATKTTLDGTTPKWAVGDKICLLDNEDSQEITVISGTDDPSAGQAIINPDTGALTIATTLDGETLYAVYPASATALESCSDGNVAFTIPSTQDGTFASANICVAKGDDKDNLIFRNATAVLKITTAADVVGVDITAASNIAGSVTASFSGDGISLTSNLTEKTVSAVCKSAPLNNVFYLAAAPVSTESTTAICYTIDKEGLVSKGDKVLQRNVIYSMDLSSITIATNRDLTGKKGILNGHEFVIIRAKYDGSNAYLKWATENVGATTSNPKGDYFMWGYTVGHTATTAGDGAFSNQTFKDGERGDDDEGFVWGNYIKFTSDTYSSSNKKVFTKYVPVAKESEYGNGGTFSDGKTTLEFADDAANANWGGTWRMPTGGNEGEFKALKEATYWNWEDGGYYVYAPQSGDAGKINDEKDSGHSYNKSDALLFFPAAGGGGGTALGNADSSGFYWSSSLDTDYPNYAYDLYFDSDSVSPQDRSNRYFGFSVRPVSD